MCESIGNMLHKSAVLGYQSLARFACSALITYKIDDVEEKHKSCYIYSLQSEGKSKGKSLLQFVPNLSVVRQRSIYKFAILILQIIHDRISPAVSSDGGVWNSDPGALLLRREYSDVGEDFPFQGILGRSRGRDLACLGR